MIPFEEFEEAVFHIADMFPEEFFRELNGGVMVRRNRRLHPAAEDHDLFILGEYHLERYLGRFIVLYYGSFESCYGYCREEELREQIRKVLLHEFRHHLESLAGERDLEIEDAVGISQYKYQKQKQKQKQKGLTESASGDRIKKVSLLESGQMPAIQRQFQEEETL